MNSQQNHEQHISIGSEQQIKADPHLGGHAPTYIDVVATMPKAEEKELIKNVRAFRNAKGHLMLSSVCEKLKESGFNIAGTSISYYSPVEEMYIFAGKEPISDESEGIPIENLSKNRLLLKFRSQDGSPRNAAGGMQEQAPAPPPMSYQFDGMNSLPVQAQNEVNNNFLSHPVTAPAPVPQPAVHHEPSNTAMSMGDDNDENNKDSEQDPDRMEIWSSAKANRRTKERKISFVIEKVSMWRKLYNGIQDSSGKIVRYSLEDAAKKVGISKKSLDDYLLQLRYGKKYGFDFNEHKEAKIGVLRAFVKKKKADEKTKGKGKDADD